MAGYTQAVSRPGRWALVFVAIGLFFLFADLRQPYIGGFFLGIGALWAWLAVRRAALPTNTIARCEACQLDLPGTAAFCPRCGRPLRPPTG